MFISLMVQPKFDSEPIPNRCTEFVKFRTEPIPKNLLTFRTVPNFESQFRRPLLPARRSQEARNDPKTMVAKLEITLIKWQCSHAQQLRLKCRL